MGLKSDAGAYDDTRGCIDNFYFSGETREIDEEQRQMNALIAGGLKDYVKTFRIYVKQDDGNSIHSEKISEVQRNEHF